MPAEKKDKPKVKLTGTNSTGMSPFKTYFPGTGVSINNSTGKKIKKMLQQQFANQGVWQDRNQANNGRKLNP